MREWIYSNRQKLVVGIGLILLIAIVCTVVFWPQKEPAQIEVPSVSTTQNEYVKTSTKDWSEHAWICGHDASEIEAIIFSPSLEIKSAQKAWVFDGVSFYSHNNRVFIITGNKLKITGSLHGAFSEMPNLKTVQGLERIDTSAVLDMGAMFKNDPSLCEIDEGFLETDSVLLAESMFQNCSSLKELDLSTWDMSNTLDMDYMFSGCTSLDAIKLPKTRDVMSLDRVFEKVGLETDYKTEITGTIETANCENMSYMFSESCLYDYEIAQSLNTKSLKNAEGMFYGCAIGRIDLSGWDTSQLETAEKMFYGNMYMTDCNIQGWNVGALQNCNSMFSLCTSLQEMTLDWENIISIKDCQKMFRECVSLKTIDLSCFNDCVLGDAREMFAVCPALETVYCNGFSADAADRMFIKDYNIRGAIPFSEEQIGGEMATVAGYFRATR